MTYINFAFTKVAKILNTYVFKDQPSTKDRPMFSKSERKNIFIYILAIMFYKFGLESYLGATRALAVDRFTESGLSTFTYLGYLDGFQASAQCIGSILVGAFMKFLQLKTVLFGSMTFLAIITSLIMIIEGSTGGTFPKHCTSSNNLPPECTGAISGNWDPRGIIPIFVLAGVPYGCVEVIRRVIPMQIVGGDESKLKKMDSLVHIFYETSGTAGAFFAAYVSLSNGKAFAPIVTPIFFAISAIIFYFIQSSRPSMNIENLESETSTTVAAAADPIVTGVDTEGKSQILLKFKLNIFAEAFTLFFSTVWFGFKIIFLDNRFTWLIFGYSIPLVFHRFIENGIASVYAKLVLKESAYASFIIAGSNFGELCGAMFVFFNISLVPTPIPWVRWDAAMLNLTWLYYNAISPEKLSASGLACAGIMAGIMGFISAGWASGDVSMAAFIQKNCCDLSTNITGGSVSVTPIAAVMSFLYVAYIVIYAFVSIYIGYWLDSYISKPSTAQRGIELYFYWFAGVMFSLVSIAIFFNTFTPRGSWKLNPLVLDGYRNDEDDAEKEEEEEEEDVVAARTAYAVPISTASDAQAHPIHNKLGL